MAKTKKKKNYRLRKSVRRTLGALFMISAIIVAAIPFPDAAATNGEGTITEEGGSGENGGNSTSNQGLPSITITPLEELEYKDIKNDEEINKNVDLIGPFSEGTLPRTPKYEEEFKKLVKNDIIKSAFTMRYTEEGVWQYEEQFKYYLLDEDNDAINEKEPASNNGAVIVRYNNEFSVKTIKLSGTINSGSYVKVDTNTFNKYFEDKTENYIELKYSERNSDKAKRFEHYFPTEYEKFVKLCEDYENYNTASDTEKEDMTEIKLEDVKISGNPANIGDESLRGEFFCDFALVKEQPSINLFNKGFEMVKVEDPTSNSSTMVIWYMARAKEGAANDAGLRIDTSNGFLYTSLTKDTYTLKGIAQSAFSGVTNSMTLELPETIKYIGDEAFKDSFVTKIDVAEVEAIGNGAFKNSQLSEIIMSTQTKYIGTEAFSNTLLTTVNFPYSILKIGIGAFAKNKNLTNIVFSDTSTSSMEICDYAFYECPKLVSQTLNNIPVSSIGIGAFAIETLDSGSCTRFEFPNSLTEGKDIGAHVLAGRTELKTVVMPNLLGQTTPTGDPTKLDSTIFKGCSGLESVIFPDSCKYVEFDKEIFSEVENSDFYVQGPEISKNSNPSFPRTSTWKCVMNYVNETDYDYVPYVYYINNQKYYEVSKGSYRLLVDPQGVLTSCILMEDKALDPFSIPGEVGNIKVTGIAEGCFDKIDPTVKVKIIDKIISLRIEDGGAIKQIANNAFENAPQMTSVYLGDSVEIIGNEAFHNCTVLENVTFGKNINKIGERAFQGCLALDRVIFNTPDDLNKFPVSNIGKEAFDTYDSNKGSGADKLTFVGAVDPAYGPFAWAMDSENFVNRELGLRVCYETGNPYNQKIILDNRNNYPTLVDYLQYKDLENIDTKRTDTKETVKLMDKLNNGWELTVMDGFIVDAVSNLVIPKGVKSIDVKGFMNNTSKETQDAKYASIGNDNNVKAYLLSDSNYGEYFDHGLFNGDCADGDDFKSVKKAGNDRLKSVKMYTVEYLPNENEIGDMFAGRSRNIESDIIAENGLAGGAFYSCENLETVSLGEIKDIGELPFEGCYKLNSVAFGSDSAGNTTDYVYDNRIIYEKIGENNYKILQCLGSRGDSELPKDYTVSTDYDSKFANVSEIAVGAFSDCPYLREVNFEGNTVLTELPDKCFLGCKPLPDASNYGLGTITLPEQVRDIGRLSMAHCDSIDLTIKGREVSLASDAFDGCGRVKVWAYDDTAAYKTAQNMNSVEVKPLPEGETVYKVQFYDYDFKTTIGKEQQVKQGDVAVEPQRPTRTGYKFVGWSTDEWSKGVTKDLNVIAMYETDTTSTGGSGNGGNNNGGSGSGSTNNGTNVNGGIDTNGDGIPDVDKDGNKLYKLTVTNGEGSGYYKAGQTVTIKAGNAPTGAGFANWSCSNQNLIFEDYTDWITTLTMVASDVTVVCNFTGYYKLEVEYGSGSGSYPAGTRVAISAVEAPQGRKFASWKINEGQPTVEDSKKATTFITMPKGNAKITATYMDTGKTSVSSNSTSSKNNTSVIITKPGISDKDKASAYVSGSSDNFIVKISESLDATDEVQRALQKKYPDMSRIKYFAMDITLYDAKGENKIANTDGLKVNITMPIPDALREYAGNNRVGAVVNGELETLNPKFTTINGVPSISFTATHFSPYTIYVDTGNAIVSDTLDATPKTGDIHPKWFLSLGLACISIILFTKRDRRYTIKA